MTEKYQAQRTPLRVKRQCIMSMQTFLYFLGCIELPEYYSGRHNFPLHPQPDQRTKQSKRQAFQLDGKQPWSHFSKKK